MLATWDLKEGLIASIDPHSEHKLELLRKYFEEYLQIVGKSGRRRNTFPLCFVDGFAGGGQYKKDGMELLRGSPLLALQAALEFEASVNPDGHEQQRVENRFRFIFIEANPQHYEFLVDQLKEMMREHPILERFIREKYWHINTLQGEFDSYSEKIINMIHDHSPKSERAIFFLDQFGFKDVKLATVHNILNRLKASEVILTISTDWMVDKSNNGQLEGHLAAFGLPTSQIETISSLLKNEQIPEGYSRAQYRREICQKFVINAFASPKDLFYNPYCIRSSKSNKGYIFLQLTKNIRGKEVMLDLINEMGGLTGYVCHEGGLPLPIVPRHDNSGSNYLFAEEDKKRNAEMVKKEIYKRIEKEGQLIALDLYSKIANDTPITKKDIYDAIFELYQEKSITARTQVGRGARTVNDDTILAINRQLQFLM